MHTLRSKNIKQLWFLIGKYHHCRTFSKSDATTQLNAGGFVSGTHLSGEKLRSRNKLHLLLWALHPLSIRFLLWVAMFFFLMTTRHHIPKGIFFLCPATTFTLNNVQSSRTSSRWSRRTRKDFGASFHSFQKDWSISQQKCFEEKLLRVNRYFKKTACRGMYLVCTWVNALILCYISKNGSRFKGLETETWQKQSQCSHLLEGPLECLCQDCYSLGESPHRRGVRKGSRESIMIPPCPTPPILCWR